MGYAASTLNQDRNCSQENPAPTLMGQGEKAPRDSTKLLRFPKEMPFSLSLWTLHGLSPPRSKNWLVLKVLPLTLLPTLVTSLEMETTQKKCL